MYTCGWLMLMYGKSHHNVVIILQLKLVKYIKPQIKKNYMHKGHSFMSLNKICLKDYVHFQMLHVSIKHLEISCLFRLIMSC